MQRLYF